MADMLKNGTIGLDQAQAGRRFRTMFHKAGHVSVRALDPGKVPGTRGPGHLSDAVVEARIWIAGRRQ